MKPLSGIKVVELSAYAAAPAAARVLGELGAEVIKVEGLKGDPNRQIGLINRMPIEDDENPSFDTTNFNKKFVCIDTKRPEGKELLGKLLETADVFVTNYRTQVLVNMGLDYDTVKEKYPKLVWAQVLGYAEKGPERNTPGFDYTAYGARGGLTGTVYQKGQEPINGISAFGDFQTSICLVAGILGALVGRQTTGCGDKVTASLHGTALYMLNWGILGAKYGSSYPKARKEATTPSINTYKGKDGGWLQMCGAAYNLYYDRIMQAIGREDLVADPRYRDLKTIQENGDNIEVIRIIEEAMAQKTCDEWVAIFNKFDVPCEKCYTFEDVLVDPQAWESGIISKVQYENGHEGIAVKNPLNIASVGEPDFVLSKRLGFHTKEVLCGEYGISEEELEKMAADGIIKC